MRFLYVLVFFNLIFVSRLHAQSGCKQSGNYNSLLSELKSRNTRSDKHKLTQAHLENIARYWVADCKCKNGVSTMDEAKKLYQEAFSNKGHHTDFFLENGRSVDKDMSPIGDLAPPFAVFTPSSCLKGNDSSSGMSLESATDCTLESSRVSSLDGQLGAYASQFFIAFCQCKEGVSSKEYEKQLIATMKLNHKNFNEFRNAATTPLSTQPLTKCKIVEGAGGVVEKPLFQRSFDEIITGDELSNALTDFMSELSAAGAGPGIQALATEMKQNQQKIDQVRADTEAVFGQLDQSSIEMLNMAENVMQAVSIGKAIFGKQKEPTLEETLSPSQKQVRELMGELSQKLRLIYDEVAIIPNYPTFDEKTLASLENIEKRFNGYNVTTSQARMKFIWFMDHDGYPTLEQYQQASSRIDRMNSEELLQEIATIEKNYNMNNVIHIANKREAFKAVQSKIDLYKARCYENIGDTKKADELRANLNYNVPINDAIKLSLESYGQKDFYSTTQYTDIIQDHFSNEVTLRILYTDLMSLSYNFGSLYRYEINYMMAMGIISYASSNQISQAQEALKGLQSFHQTFDLTYQAHLEKSSRKKAYGYTDEEFRQENLRSKMVLIAVEAYLGSITGNVSDPLAAINEALKINKEAPAPTGSTGLELWLTYLKAEILVKNEKFAEAKDALRDIKMLLRVTYNYSAVNKNDIDFLNAYIRFKSKDYSGALLANRINKQKNPNSPRIYALEEQIYLAKGDKENAQKSKNEYLTIINK